MSDGFIIALPDLGLRKSGLVPDGFIIAFLEMGLHKEGLISGIIIALLDLDLLES